MKKPGGVSTLTVEGESMFIMQEVLLEGSVSYVSLGMAMNEEVYKHHLAKLRERMGKAIVERLFEIQEKDTGPLPFVEGEWSGMKQTFHYGQFRIIMKLPEEGWQERYLEDSKRADEFGLSLNMGPYRIVCKVIEVISD